MRRASNIERDLAQIQTVQDLTSVFESIASMRIAKTKDLVVSSSRFFHELWQIYSQLRVDQDQFGGGQKSAGKKKGNADQANRDRVALVAITGSGGLSGDIDERTITTMLKEYDPATTDLIVLGAHGATQLAQKRVPIAHYYGLPDTDKAMQQTGSSRGNIAAALAGNMNVSPIIAELTKYKRTTVFYPTYVSLTVQDVAKIELISAVRALSAETAAKDEEVISNRDYVFEPSLTEIADYMESIMLGVALGQTILESKLAQFASRFNAMSAAKNKSKDLHDELMTEYRRSKRSESDERLKEITTSMVRSG